MIDCYFYCFIIKGTKKQLFVCYNLKAIIFLSFLEWSWLKLCVFRLFRFEGIAKKQQCLLWTATKKLHVINVGHKLQRTILYDTRQDVLLEQFTALNVPTFQHPRRLTWIITLPRNTVQQDPTTTTLVKNAALSFQVFIPWDFTNNVVTQQKLPSVQRRRRCKVLRTQEMTRAWKKSYSRVDVSWLILKYKNGDIACSILLSTTLQLKLSKKNDRVLDNLKSAAKLNLALGFFLKKVQDWKFRYFYAHENNTL